MKLSISATLSLSPLPIAISLAKYSLAPKEFLSCGDPNLRKASNSEPPSAANCLNNSDRLSKENPVLFSNADFSSSVDGALKSPSQSAASIVLPDENLIIFSPFAFSYESISMPIDLASASIDSVLLCGTFPRISPTDLPTLSCFTVSTGGWNDESMRSASCLAFMKISEVLEPLGELEIALVSLSSFSMSLGGIAPSVDIFSRVWSSTSGPDPSDASSDKTAKAAWGSSFFINSLAFSSSTTAPISSSFIFLFFTNMESERFFTSETFAGFSFDLRELKPARIDLSKDELVPIIRYTAAFIASLTNHFCSVTTAVNPSAQASWEPPCAPYRVRTIGTSDALA